MKINKNSKLFTYIKKLLSFWYGEYNERNLPSNMISLLILAILGTIGFIVLSIIMYTCIGIYKLFSYLNKYNPLKITYHNNICSCETQEDVNGCNNKNCNI